jgi:hypothetical protein
MYVEPNCSHSPVGSQCCGAVDIRNDMVLGGVEILKTVASGSHTVEESSSESGSEAGDEPNIPAGASVAVHSRGEKKAPKKNPNKIVD